MMIPKITFSVDYNWLKHLDTQLNKPTNQVFESTNKKALFYFYLGTSVINRGMSPTSLHPHISLHGLVRNCCARAQNCFYGFIARA